MTRQIAVAATALVLLSGTLPAQRDSLRRAARGQILPGAKPNARLNNPGRGAEKDEANLPVRQQVQQAFRARVRQELNLDQPKARRLNQTEQSFTRQRNELNRSEKETRQGLAAAMQDSTPDQGKIDQYLEPARAGGSTSAPTSSRPNRRNFRVFSRRCSGRSTRRSRSS